MTIIHGLLSIYLIFSVILAIFFAAYTLSKGTTYLVKVFCALCILVSIYLLGYLMEVNSITLGQMMLWNQIQYIAIPFYPVLGLIISLIYTKTIKSINNWILSGVFAIPVLTFFIHLTNPLHYLYYTGFDVKTNFYFNYLVLGKGPLYYVYCIYLTVTSALTSYFYIKNYNKQSTFERARNKIMIFASLIPFVGLLLILIDFGNLGIDYTALFLPISVFMMLLSLFKYDFLQLKTLAREVLFEKNIDATILIDNTNRLMDYNPAALKLFKNLNKAVSGQQIEQLLSNESTFLEAIKTDTKKDLRIDYDNTYGYFEFKSVTITDNLEHKVGRLISLINITERKHDQEALSILATTDSLTGLNNRGQFMKLANVTMDNSLNCNDFFSLLILDLDHFKNINDTYGHACGDAVLKHLGAEMNNFFRKTAIHGRLGGEEFAVLLPNTDITTAERIAEEFRLKISNTPALYEDTYIYFTFSIGVSAFNKKLKNFDEVFKLADKGLYESKANGRNKTTVKTIS